MPCPIYDSRTIYKYHLALIVVLDKENHTQLAMQVLLLREQTEYFVLLFETFKELCAGGLPQVNRPSMCSVHVPVAV